MLVWRIVCVGALLAGACGGGSGPSTVGHGQPSAFGRSDGLTADRTDLRSPDVDGRMDPVSQSIVFTCADADRLEVFFDARGTVALVAGGRPLAYGTVGTRAVNRDCRRLGRLHGVPMGALRERDTAATLTCAVPRSARFEVHPITEPGGEIGSTVSVLTADLRRILISAVLEPYGSRIYDAHVCRAGPHPVRAGRNERG
jgi:hypothetical protein